MGAAETDAIWLSLSVATRSVALNLPFAILVAWILTRTRFTGRTIFDAFVHLPLVLPPVVIGYLLLVVFGIRGPHGIAPARVERQLNMTRLCAISLIGYVSGGASG